MADDADPDRFRASGCWPPRWQGRRWQWLRSTRANRPGPTARPSSSISARCPRNAGIGRGSGLTDRRGQPRPRSRRAMVRHPRVAKRYLAVEGHRALIANDALLPRCPRRARRSDTGIRSDSAATSLSIAQGKDQLGDPPAVFGVIRPKKVLAASSRAAQQVDHETAGHVPRRQARSRSSRNSMTARSTTPTIPTCSPARSVVVASSGSG